MNFVYVSGRPSLDLVGTLKWRWRAVPEEQLNTPRDVGAWALGAGLTDTALRTTPDDLARAVAVRESMYRSLQARLTGGDWPARDRRLLNRVADGQPLGFRLDPHGRLRRVASVEQLLTTVVLDAFELMAGADLARLRECEQEDCTRLFLDASRGARRRWCGMTECGNRAKVRAFRERRRGTGA